MNARDALTALYTLSTPTQSALIDARQRGEEARQRQDSVYTNPYKRPSEEALWTAWFEGYWRFAPDRRSRSIRPIIMDDEDAYKADLQSLKQKCLMADRRRVEDSLRKNSLLSLCFSALSIVPREHLGPELRATLDSVQDQVEMELARKEGGV